MRILWDKRLRLTCSKGSIKAPSQPRDQTQVGWVGKIPWRRESLPTPGFWPENSMDCIVHAVAKSWTRLSDFHFHLLLLLFVALLVCCLSVALLDKSQTKSQCCFKSLFFTCWSVCCRSVTLEASTEVEIHMPDLLDSCTGITLRITWENQCGRARQSGNVRAPRPQPVLQTGEEQRGL